MRLQLPGYVAAAALLVLAAVPLLGAARANDIEHATLRGPNSYSSRPDPLGENFCRFGRGAIYHRRGKVARPSRGPILKAGIAVDHDAQEFVIADSRNATDVWGFCNDRLHTAPPALSAAHAAFWKIPKTIVDMGTYAGDSDSVLLERDDKGESGRE